MTVIADNPLRAARKKRGMSQYALSELSGVSRVTISNIELGKRLVKIQHLRAIAAALDVPMRELLEPQQAVTAFTREDAAQFLGVGSDDLTYACELNSEVVADWIKRDPQRISLINELMAP